MLHIGIGLIAIAVFAFFAPLLGRQFALVSLITSTGLSLPAAAVLLALAGAGIVHRSLRKPSPTEASTESPTSFWPWVSIAALAVVVAVVLSAFLPGKNHSSGQSNWVPTAPTRAQSHEEFIAESFTFSPLPGVPVEAGELRIASAKSPREGEIRLLLIAVRHGDRSVLENSLARAIRLIKPTLCGPTGVLALRHLTESAVTLIIFEQGAVVGELPLPTRFCEAK